MSELYDFVKFIKDEMGFTFHNSSGITCAVYKNDLTTITIVNHNVIQEFEFEVFSKNKIMCYYNSNIERLGIPGMYKNVTRLTDYRDIIYFI